MKILSMLSTLFVIAIGSTSVHAASFNCNYAKLPSEVAICQSSELHRLDEKMARKYYRIKRRAPRSVWRTVRAEQRRWQRRRNSCGYDQYCLEDSYVYRIRALNHWLSEY